MITINFSNEISSDLEKAMSDDLSEYEKSFGIDVNHEKFSLTVNVEEQTIGVLNAFTAYAEIYIEDLWVDKRHRGKGYGKQLIESLIKKFEGSGFNNINLCTSRFQAPGFYEKCGFKLEFIRENHQNPELSKLFFVRFFNNKNQWQGKCSTNAAYGSHLSLSPESLSNKNTESTTYTIQATSKPNPDDVQWLCDGIMGNAQYIKGHNPVEFFGFFLRDDQGSLHGGLNGDILYGGMYISQLFIEDSLRSQGYGSQLMQKAEALAKEKNCNFVSVNTMDFEALEFYKKHGFYIEFSRNGYDKNSVFYFLRKNLVNIDETQPTGLGLPFEYQKSPEYFNAINTNLNTNRINSLIADVLRKYEVKTVLDLTCGTGSQVFHLMKLGFECTGADFSPDLLKQARIRAKLSGQDISFIDGDMRTLKQGKFDAVITIFNAIGHLTIPDFSKAVRNISDNLKYGGIYVFDILNLAAMNDEKIPDLAYQIHKNFDQSQILASQCSSLEKESGRLMSYNSVMIQKNGDKPTRFVNDFILQLYTAKALEEILIANGFEILNQFDLSGEEFIESKSESMLTIARKVTK